MDSSLGYTDVHGVGFAPAGIRLGGEGGSGNYGVRPFFNEEGVLAYLLMGPEKYLKLNFKDGDGDDGGMSMPDLTDDEKQEFSDSGVSDQTAFTIKKIETAANGKVSRVPVLVECPYTDVLPEDSAEEGEDDG